MAKHFCISAYLLSLSLQCFYSVASEGTASSVLFDNLLARLKALEVSDFANKAKIAKMESEFKAKYAIYERDISGLKLRMNEMESNFKFKEAALFDEINKMKNILGVAQLGDKSTDHTKLAGEDYTGRLHSRPKRIKRQGGNNQNSCECPETKVAFSATHTDNNVHNLGHNQVIQFPVDITNIGNAYDNNTSAFTAPVDGTYVLHATVMGIDGASTSYQHMRAHFDVDGVAYSKFYVTPFDQSSQMLVIDLYATQTVTVRNDFTDSGYVGQHYTTFSGFLLYQHPPTDGWMELYREAIKLGYGSNSAEQKPTYI